MSDLVKRITQLQELVSRRPLTYADCFRVSKEWDEIIKSVSDLEKAYRNYVQKDWKYECLKS